MRIAIANAKGGVAKTTTALLLAATLRHRGFEVSVLDADPQSSASLWADAAAGAGDPLPFEVRPANLSTLGRLAGCGGQWVLVDCPPAGRLLEAAVRAADSVVIPTSDSPLDLQQAWAMLEETARLGRPAAVLVVKAETNTSAYKETLGALREHETARFDTVIPKRQPIKKALGTNPKRRELFEFRDLADELVSLAREFHQSAVEGGVS
ncbi:MAG: ParA family protein [Bifidobacterium crudilactis]|jgi:chromosome partitioning protein|nr:ParA family protein [Bifidobacterium crudilactis]MCI1889873.1 ParA family protein [Bifidobacterium crudilactis]